MALLAAGAALLLGCAAQSAPGTSSDTSRLSLSVAPSRAAVASPQQTARADVAARLGAFVAPPGARRLAGAPAGSAGLFPALTVGGKVVAAVGWWTYPGTQQQAADWLTSHVPRGTVGTGSSGRGRKGAAGGVAQVDSVFYGQRATALLSQRRLEIDLATFHGSTLLRIDAVDTWRPAHPAAAVIPSGVTRIVVTADPASSSAAAGVPGPANSAATSGSWTQVTVTDPGPVAKVVALVNALPTPVWGIPCLGGASGGIVVGFYRDSGGATATTPVAVAVDSAAGCGSTELSVRGGPQKVALVGSEQEILAALKLTLPSQVQ
ncbi:hypothetical protein ABUW04_22020 [Streptacidiphilus sp. N1-10]|uniref:Lipoprotein n=1 Tax=Streptacidiphilus jeojiensis TaxID=3229225 RepID=A0ABV6XS20_9ACTN